MVNDPVRWILWILLLFFFLERNYLSDAPRYYVFCIFTTFHIIFVHLWPQFISSLIPLMILKETLGWTENMKQSRGQVWIIIGFFLSFLKCPFCDVAKNKCHDTIRYYAMLRCRTQLKQKSDRFEYTYICFFVWKHRQLRKNSIQTSVNGLNRRETT